MAAKYTLKDIYDSSNNELDVYITRQGGNPQPMNDLQKRYSATVYKYLINTLYISERKYAEHKNFKLYYLMKDKDLFDIGQRLRLVYTDRIDMFKAIMDIIMEPDIESVTESLTPSTSDQQAPLPPIPASGGWQDIISNGSLNGQKYVVGAELGRGGFGLVESIIMGDGTMKARKKIYVKPDKLSTALEEISVWQLISAYPDCNVNIVCYYDYMIQSMGDQFAVYIFMDYIRGPNLNDMIKEYIKQKLTMDLITFKTINSQIASALSYIHGQKVAHRDIKANNIISGQNIKVVDMGLSCILSQYAAECPRCVVCTNKSVGTPFYMAPELYDKNYIYPYTAFAVDIWALGILMYYMIYQYYPFFSTDRAQLKKIILGNEPYYNPTYTQYNNIIRQCLNKNPAARPTANKLYLLIYNL